MAENNHLSPFYLMIHDAGKDGTIEIKKDTDKGNVLEASSDVHTERIKPENK